MLQNCKLHNKIRSVRCPKYSRKWIIKLLSIRHIKSSVACCLVGGGNKKKKKVRVREVERDSTPLLISDCSLRFLLIHFNLLKDNIYMSSTTLCATVETSIETTDLLKPYLIITWEESNTACTVYAKHYLTNKQNNSPTTSRQRITQSTCKLISCTCKRQRRLGKRKGGSRRKKRGKDKRRQETKAASTSLTSFLDLAFVSECVREV